MAPTTFNDLSDDLKASIIGHVRRPSDLVRLCHTSRVCHDLAVRSLYHSLNLIVGGIHDIKVISMFNPNNKGLRHIRKLRIELVTGTHICNQPSQVNLVVRTILEVLPENILEQFEWAPWDPFCAENMLLLYSKQRKMTRLEGILLDRSQDVPPINTTQERFAELFDNCKKLACYPDSQSTMMRCNSLLSKVKNITKLVIHTNFEDSALLSRDLNDAPAKPGLLTSTIFKHMLPFDKCTPMQSITSLRLCNVHLRQCAETYCRVIDLSQLLVLRIDSCTGTDALLSELCKSAHLPQNLSHFEIQHTDNPESDGLTALDAFLGLVPCLKVLDILMWSTSTLPSVEGITRQGPTLSILSIHCCPRSLDSRMEEAVYSPSDFEKICTAAPMLEQLSIAFPMTRVHAMPKTDWLTFVQAAVKIPCLVTLQITTWPKTKSQGARNSYLTLLRALASRIFRTAAKGGLDIFTDDDEDNVSIASSTAHDESVVKTPEAVLVRAESKLRILAFGTTDELAYARDSKTIRVFCRLKQVSPVDNSVDIVALRINWKEVRALEERTKVLRFWHGKGNEMPAGEWYSDDDSD